MISALLMVAEATLHDCFEAAEPDLQDKIWVSLIGRAWRRGGGFVVLCARAQSEEVPDAGGI